MVTVKIVDEDSGRPAKGVRVALGFDGFFRGVTRDEWTDSNGEAHFDAEPGRGRVFVNGRTAYQGHLAGRIVVYV